MPRPVNGFKEGDRVMVVSNTEALLNRTAGKQGTVVKVGHTYVHVRMDRSGRTVRFHPSNLMHVE